MAAWVLDGDLRASPTGAALLQRPAISCRHITQPLQLRHKTLRNRIVFGAHTNSMAEVGLPSDRQIGYLRDRALGGAVMIVMEPMPVHQATVLTHGNSALRTTP